jgi:putative phosphoserine phosphatase/1-acylglycerol-3-phosphate O-acyltransferase
VRPFTFVLVLAAAKRLNNRPTRRRTMGRPARSSIDFNTYLTDLPAGQTGDGGPVVVFFDLDRTLIAGYSITSLALEKMWSGSLSPGRIIRHAGIFLHWGLGWSDYHQLLENTVSAMKGMSEAEIIDLGERAFERRIRPIIYEEGRQLIQAHARLGHEPVLVTSATRYQALPIARELGIGQIYCTELEIEHGRITGSATPCYGPGKKKAADVHMGFREADLGEAYFYTDSCEDLPLLDEVGRPVAVNAKASLARIADERGWPQLSFEILARSVADRAA